MGGISNVNESGTMVVGLTGQSGAGKSSLSRMFAARGVEVIDADRVARDAIEQSANCLMDLVLEFSTEVIHPDASLNRARLAELCFGDKNKLKRLNDITFPYIIEAIVHKLENAKARRLPMVVLDAPTLFESGLNRRCDRIIAVIADRDTRIERVIARDQISREDAELRINAQNPDAFYTGRSHEVLHNDTDFAAFEAAFLALYDRLERSWEDGSYLLPPEPPTPEPPTPEPEEAEPETEQPVTEEPSADQPPDEKPEEPPDSGELEELAEQED